jgi:hypothetical protein
MHRFLLASVLALALAACGGKSKPSAEPTAATCCCVGGGDANEIVAETVCTERGGTCEPTETCEATDPSIDNDGGGSDPDDY